MKGFLKLLFVVVCGCALAICLLGVVLVGVLHLEPNHVLQKMNLNKALYLLLLVILAECCFFANDLLAYISQRWSCHSSRKVMCAYFLTGDRNVSNLELR